MTAADSRDALRWDILIAARLYAIITFIILPVAHVSIQLEYLQPVGLIIMGFAAWLILKFVLLEARTASRRFLNVSLAFLVPASAAIFVNFLSGLLINMARDNPGGSVLALCIVVGAGLYFPAMIIAHPLRGLNSRAASMKSREGKFHLLRKYSLELLLVCWTLISIGILTLPYRTHFQDPPEKTPGAGATRLGFWTGDQFFDRQRAGPGRYVSDDMLEKFGGAGVYLVYSGIRTHEMRGNMVRDFIRCREHGVEINVSFAPTVRGYTYVNIWTFESLKDQIEEVLSFLQDNGLLGDPVTTLVYDMEPPTGKFFPLYGWDPETVAGLREYYRVQKVFREFNRHVREDYGLDVRICSETFQAIDPRDRDDDLIALYGVLSDDMALMSHMIYRRAYFAENYVLDSARYLKNNDTIILNSWKFEGYQCWGDIDCAIKDARLVAGYPGKNFNVEVWALCYFLDSFGKDGLFEFVDAVTADKSAWPRIEVNNSWPESPLWDLAFIGIATLDIYGPVFRAVFHAY